MTEESARRHGIGSAILTWCERFPAHGGYDRYIIRTWDDETHPTVRFYLNQGFVTCARFTKRGVPMRVMEKGLFLERP